MDNKLLFNLQLDKKDLEEFSKALFVRTNMLELENQQLKDKLKHLEELLANIDVPLIGLSQGKKQN